jgi:hypothetical protein
LSWYPSVRPDQDLEHLLERAQPARQGDERVAALLEQGLALAHGGRDDQLVHRSSPMP